MTTSIDRLKLKGKNYVQDIQNVIEDNPHQEIEEVGEAGKCLDGFSEIVCVCVCVCVCVWGAGGGVLRNAIRSSRLIWVSIMQDQDRTRTVRNMRRHAVRTIKASKPGLRSLKRTNDSVRPNKKKPDRRLEVQKLPQTLLHDSEEKERDRKQAAEFQNQKLQLEAQKLEQASDDKSKDRDFQVNKFDALVRLAQEILEQCLSEVTLDAMSISVLVPVSDNIFKYHRRFRVASCDLGAILGKEYSDVQNNLVTGISEKAKFKMIEIFNQIKVLEVDQVYPRQKESQRNMI